MTKKRTCFPAEVSKSSRQSTLQFKPVSKKPKKNPWSDDDSEANVSDSEMDEEVAPREKVQRKTKGEPAPRYAPLPLCLYIRKPSTFLFQRRRRDEMRRNHPGKNVWYCERKHWCSSFPKWLIGSIQPKQLL